MTQPSGYSHITQQEYESVAGPDWPCYDDFCQHKNVASFVYEEIDLMLKPPISFDHTSFCILPFYGMEFWAGSKQTTPSTTFCCLVPDGQDRESVKKDMLNGIRPEACRACWALEEQGLVSDRLIKNKSIDHDLQKDIQQLFTGYTQEKNSIIHYKIDSNNTCNSTCVICNSTYSTAWAQLERKNGKTPQKTWNISPAKLDSNIDYSTAASIGFRGGEPLLSDKTWYVLEKLLQDNNTECFINFTTNGSIPLTPKQKNIISKFKTVTFNFSIDGIGPVFEYLRYPLRWSDLEKNVQYCRDNNILIRSTYSICNLNILYHLQTKAWFDSNQIIYSQNPVYYPVYFRPAALPKKIKDLILQQQKNEKLTNALLDSHTPLDDEHYKLFLQNIAQQDAWKGIKMQDYLPELSKLLG